MCVCCFKASANFAARLPARLGLPSSSHDWPTTINAASFSDARLATCAASIRRETCWITFKGLAIVAVGSLIARPIFFSPWSTARILIEYSYSVTTEIRNGTIGTHGHQDGER